MKHSPVHNLLHAKHSALEIMGLQRLPHIRNLSLHRAVVVQIRFWSLGPLWYRAEQLIQHESDAYARVVIIQTV